MNRMLARFPDWLLVAELPEGPHRSGPLGQSEAGLVTICASSLRSSHRMRNQTCHPLARS
jgi:hypothetical protein